MDKKQREKFVVRFDDEKTRKAIEKVADEHHISMNAFILQAIDEKLGRGARMDLVIESAGKAIACSIGASHTHQKLTEG